MTDGPLLGPRFWFMYARPWDEPKYAPNGVVGPSQVDAPVGNVTLVAVEDHEAAGSRKPLPGVPRKKLPLWEVATVHSP